MESNKRMNSLNIPNDGNNIIDSSELDEAIMPEKETNNFIKHEETSDFLAVLNADFDECSKKDVEVFSVLSSELTDEDTDDEDISMNEDQFTTLLEFQNYTGVERFEESHRILRHCNWDLQKSVAGYWESQNEEQSATKDQEFDPMSYLSKKGSFARVIFSLILSGIIKPINVGLNIFLYFIGLLRVLISLLGFDYRFIKLSDITNPIDDVVTFISEYELKYGMDHPVFFQGAYHHAEVEAKKASGLLVYLHNNDHVNTAAFCRNVMTSKDFQDIIRDNLLFWGCSISKPEGYKISKVLRPDTYPFLAIFVLKRDRMKIVRIIEGKTSSKPIVARIQQILKYVNVDRQQRFGTDIIHNLERNKGLSFEKCLQAELEKERQKPESDEPEQLNMKIELEQQDEETQRIKEQKANTAKHLKPEPPLDHPDVIRTVIKLPNETRLERRFLKTDSLKHLHDFIFCHPDTPNHFEIIANFPTRNLLCMPTTDCSEPPSFMDAQISTREMLFVYDLDEITS